MKDKEGKTRTIQSEYRRVDLMEINYEKLIVRVANVVFVAVLVKKKKGTIFGLAIRRVCVLNSKRRKLLLCNMERSKSYKVVFY